jgi:YhcH/YjgK/YiaL family protein
MREWLVVCLCFSRVKRSQVLCVQHRHPPRHPKLVKVGYEQWEARRRYIDLQSLASGTERIGYAPLGRLEPRPYDDAKDMLRLSGPGEFLTLGPGDFMLLWPGDAHMPGIAVDEPSPVKKVVVKIRLGEE